MPARFVIDPRQPTGKAAQRGSCGYALIALMIVMTLLLVSLTAALPSIYQASQRRREAETIFRGDQYARAIYLFYRRMGRYPVSVQDLLKTGDVRFLRKAYRDPLSPTGRWRFIHAAGGGILLDSWNQPVLSSSLPPHASALDLAFSSSAAANGTSPAAGAPATGSKTNGKVKHPPSTCDGPLDSGGGSAGQTRQTGTLLGAFIVGVAPCSNAHSIRVFDHHSHYDHWEFIGLKYQPYRLPQPSAPGVTPASEMGNPNPTTTPATPAQGSGADSGP